MLPTADDALKRAMMIDFFVWPAVLAIIQDTMMGLPPLQHQRPAR
jgi:energy-converting hydrogenase Eha subunit A